MFFLATHRKANKTNKEEKRKDAYLGPAWVPFQLQPQFLGSNSSSLRHTPIPTTAPAPSLLSLDGSKTLAMDEGGGGVVGR